VRLLRRRSPVADERAADTADGGDAGGLDAADPRRPTGKGRPTPKRREAQKRRTGPVAPPPRTRREAYRRTKGEQSVRRAEFRQGMRTGDDKYMLARDRGPVRKLVRDIVDSRRNAGVLFLLIAFIAFFGLLMPSVQLRAYATSLWLAAFLLVVIDTIFLGVRIRREVRERHPDATDRASRLILYGASRAVMIRRLRMPPPQVKVGDKV
jgi:hypothetical protein